MKLYQKIISGICVLSIVLCGAYVAVKYINRDTKAPEIQFESDSIVKSVTEGKSALLEGVSALDNKDGDVTKSILVENITKKSGTKNEFEATYVAFDKAGNHGKAKRTVIYEDYYGPRFLIKQNLRFPLNAVTSLKGIAEAYDGFGTDLTPYILIEGMDAITSSDAKEGMYECTFKVKNSVGDSVELPVSVELYNSESEEENARPQVLLSDYVVYVAAGTEFNYGNYINNINDGGTISVDKGAMIDVMDDEGNISQIPQAVAEGNEGNWIDISQIQIQSDLNLNEPGMYKATYMYVSTRTGLTGSATMYIIVE